jgi:hypothetical protein
MGSEANWIARTDTVDLVPLPSDIRDAPVRWQAAKEQAAVGQALSRWMISNLRSTTLPRR